MFNQYIFGLIKISWGYLKSSKTLIFNFVLGLAGALEAYSGFLRGLFPTEEVFGLFMVVVATIGAMLRFVTSRSLRSKVEDGDI